MTPPIPPAPPPARRPRPLHRRILRGVFGVLAALWIVVEEWLWDSLVRATKWLAKLPVFRAIERLIVRLPPAGPWRCSSCRGCCCCRRSCSACG